GRVPAAGAELRGGDAGRLEGRRVEDGGDGVPVLRQAVDGAAVGPLGEQLGIVGAGVHLVGGDLRAQVGDDAALGELRQVGEVVPEQVGHVAAGRGGLELAPV